MEGDQDLRVCVNHLLHIVKVAEAGFHLDVGDLVCVLLAYFVATHVFLDHNCRVCLNLRHLEGLNHPLSVPSPRTLDFTCVVVSEHRDQHEPLAYFEHPPVLLDA